MDSVFFLLPSQRGYDDASRGLGDPYAISDQWLAAQGAICGQLRRSRRNNNRIVVESRGVASWELRVGESIGFEPSACESWRRARVASNELNDL